MKFWFWSILAFVNLTVRCTAQHEHTLFSDLPCNDGLVSGPVSWKIWPNGVTTNSNGVKRIPCGVAVKIQGGAATLGPFNGLHVEGWLQVEDDMDRVIKSRFVLVEGQLFVGASDATPYQHNVEFKLKTAPNRAELDLSKMTIHGSRSARMGQLGHKAFAIVGGRINIFGMNSACETWVRLGETAWPGATSIVVNGKASNFASCWPIGDTIALASTDYDYDDTETATIVGIVPLGNGKFEIQLDKALAKNHWGSDFDVNGASAPFQQISEAGEVALISRRVKIYGELDESEPTHGGHFIVMHTPLPQTIQGIELTNMGQQGILGKYPMHFHMAQDTFGLSTVSHLSIHDTNQRCIVIHGTHHVKIHWNVAFNTKGHCFMLEDGVEFGNEFVNNIGIINRPVAQIISDDESDDDPSTFWITNPNNTWIGNVAAGADSGFWFELRSSVRGPSAMLPEAAGVNPKDLDLREFRDNVAHSNRNHGLRTYPSGYHPDNDATFHGFKSFKNNQAGIFVHASDNLIFEGATLADNFIGIDFDEVTDCALVDSLVIGETDNVGNPTGCYEDGGFYNTNCKVWGGCHQPAEYIRNLPAGANPNDFAIGRSIARGYWYRFAPLYGVMYSRHSISSSKDDDGGNLVRNVQFSGFDSLDCRPAAAIGFNHDEKEGRFSADHAIEALQLLPGTPLLYMSPIPFFPGQIKSFNDPIIGSAYWHTALRYNNNHYIVASEESILDSGKCVKKPEWNAHLCSNSCYRTIVFQAEVDPDTEFPSQYLDARLVIQWKDSRNVAKEIILQPAVQYLDMDENTDRFSSSSSFAFVANLFENPHTFRVRLEPGSGNFDGRKFYVRNGDNVGCGSMSLHFMLENMVGIFSKDQIVKTCANAGSFPKGAVHEFLSGCNNVKILDLVLHHQVHEAEMTYSSSSVCDESQTCQVIHRQSEWKYLNNGEDPHATSLQQIGFTHYLFDDSAWARGFGALGFNEGEADTDIDSPTKGAIAYFRRKFNVVNSGCVENATFGLRYDEGIVLYLNGVELIRLNIPDGPVDGNTLAVDYYPGEDEYVYYTIPVGSVLVEGENILSASVHQRSSSSSNDGSFDLDLTFQFDASCSGQKNIQPETCDGLDNDGDGLVDEQITRPCYTPCGSGVETCIGGQFVGCTALQPTEELCDGIDQNCDGLVDNTHNTLWVWGLGYQPVTTNLQLDCPDGNVCYSGKCVPTIDHVSQDETIAPEDTWFYSDNGDSTPPAGWPLPTNLASMSSGMGGFGFGNDPIPENQNTQIALDGSKPITTYFVKQFSTPLPISQLELQLLCDSGCVIYLNGEFAMNIGMPEDVEITKDTKGLSSSSRMRTTYYPYFIDGSAIQPGTTNTLSIELHRKYSRASFDAQLFVHSLHSCSEVSPLGELVAATGQRCAVNKTVTVVDFDETWKFVDVAPAATNQWTTPSFDDSTWSSGPTPIGFSKSWLATDTGNSDAPASMFFRTTTNLTVPESCVFAIHPFIAMEDGFRLFINGMEISSANLPDDGEEFAPEKSEGRDVYQMADIAVPGLLQNGLNTIAVQVIRYKWSTNMAFNLKLEAYVDVNCL